MFIVVLINIRASSGLSWHTDDITLKSKFEEFGPVEEAVSLHISLRVILLFTSL
jgi:hypothetical protein